MQQVNRLIFAVGVGAIVYSVGFTVYAKIAEMECLSIPHAPSCGGYDLTGAFFLILIGLALVGFALFKAPKSV